MHGANRQETRERLLATAARLMWERSFQATGVDELCARADAKKGSFYHFFPSKTELAVAAIEASWDQTRAGVFEPVFSSDDGGLAQLDRLSKVVYELQAGIAEATGGFPGCPFGNLGQEMARQDERIRVTLSQIFDAHCSYIEAALDRAVGRHEIPAGDNRVRARNVFALFEGALLLAKVANDPEVFRQALPALRAVASA